MVLLNLIFLLLQAQRILSYYSQDQKTKVSACLFLLQKRRQQDPYTLKIINEKLEGKLENSLEKLQMYSLVHCYTHIDSESAKQITFNYTNKIFINSTTKENVALLSLESPDENGYEEFLSKVSEFMDIFQDIKSELDVKLTSSSSSNAKGVKKFYENNYFIIASGFAVVNLIAIIFCCFSGKREHSI